MPWTPVFDAWLNDPDWWSWIGWSVVPDVTLFAAVVWLARTLLRTQREARQQATKAEEVLARRTETLRWATELADVGAWSWDLPTGVIEWNDRAKAQFALPPGRTASLDYFFSVVHPEDRDRVRAAIDRSLADRQDYRTVFRAVHPDGTQHWIAAMGRALYGEDGTPCSMGGVTLDVTRLHQIEDEVRGLRVVTEEQASELELARRFQLLAENASDVVMETDNAGVIRWLTPAVRLRIGRAPEDLIGERFAQLVHPDDRDRVRALEAQVAQGAAAEARLRLRVAAGGYHWFSVALRPVFDDHEAVVGRVGGWRDIHREVQAQEAFATERVRLRATLEGMLDPLAIFEPVRDDDRRIVDFAYLDVNPAACVWLRTDRDQLVGKHLCESFPGFESSGLLRKLAELTDTGRPLVLDDFPFMLRDVGLRRLDVRGIRGDEWISLVWRDVSERHDVMDRLAASEEQFRLLAENSTDVIVRLDGNDKVLWVSPSVEPVLGWKPADWIGRDGRDFLATAEVRDQYDRNKAQVLAGQGIVIRTQIRSAAGDVHWMEAHSFPYRTSEGVVSGAVASLRVVDAEVRMERALERRARVDDLTGLLNRTEFLERLEALLSPGEGGVAVLWCDIDRFKEINDVHGHAAGDAVLEALGERIRGCLPSADDLGGRIGGDELMVILPGVADVDAAARVAEDLCRRAAEPIASPDGPVAATLSIGVAVARPHEGVDALLARADDAMYQAKERGKNQVVAAGEPAAVPAPKPAAVTAAS